MAATVEVVRLTGAGPTETVVTSGESEISYADTPTPGPGDYLPQPAPAGTTYARWATFRLKATVTPNGTIDNLRVFTEGDAWAGTGVALKMGEATSYDEANVADVALNTTNHTGLDAAAADASTYTAASPLAIDGTLTNPSTGQFGDYVILQAQVSDTAAAGALPAYAVVIRRDET